MRTEKPQAFETAMKTSQARAAAQGCVLIVDDDPLIRDSLEMVLKERYHVLLASSGSEALEVLEPAVDAVILDIKMPGMDGFMTDKKIKERLAQVPVIFCSAYQDMKNVSEAVAEHQPFGYIIKGRDQPGRLLEIIDRAVCWSQTKRGRP